MENLNNLEDAADRLACSIWTLRKHVANATIQVVRIGRRCLISSEEIERIRREGLPSLGSNLRANFQQTEGENRDKSIE